jgi:hypothetical protein
MMTQLDLMLAFLLFYTLLLVCDNCSCLISTITASKAATAAVLRAVKLQAVATAQDFTRIHSTLGLGKDTTFLFPFKNQCQRNTYPSTLIYYSLETAPPYRHSAGGTGTTSASQAN